MKLLAVIFDLDGTVLDNEDEYVFDKYVKDIDAPA